MEIIYPIKIITLPKNVLDSIEKIIFENPRTGIEITLVASGAKTGDSIDLSEQGSKYSINTLNHICNIGIINKNTSILYYNKNKADPKLINYLQNYEPTDETAGKLFSFWDCCINAYKKGETLNEFMPATEHHWCNKNCLASILTQEIHRQAIKQNIPQYSYLLEMLGNLCTYF